MAQKKKEGKKHRKYGRSGRRPAKARYNGEKRWEKNKARRIAKQKRVEEKKRIKKLGVAGRIVVRGEDVALV